MDPITVPTVSAGAVTVVVSTVVVGGIVEVVLVDVVVLAIVVAGTSVVVGISLDVVVASSTGAAGATSVDDSFDPQAARLRIASATTKPVRLISHLLSVGGLTLALLPSAE